MVENLEGKMRAPRIVLDDKVRFSYAQGGGCYFLINDDKNSSFHLGYSFIERVYDTDMNLIWKNNDFQKHQPVKPERNYKGLQITLTDQVVYEGANMGRHHFSLLRDRKYIGHNHEQDVALDFPYELVKAIFDNDKKLVWENLILKEEKVQFRQ